MSANAQARRPRASVASSRPVCVFALAFGMFAPFALPSEAGGQVLVDVRGAALFESYELSQAVGSLDHVSELALPIVVNANFGRRVMATVATGYARVSASRLGQETAAARGVLDTELRLAFHAVPDRFAFFTTATLPTGMGSLEAGQASMLGVLASEVIGFSAPELGGGGSVGGGVAVTAPAGRMSIGGAASFTASGAYRPVRALTDEFRPGGEMRFQLGIEGPIARRTFLRVSGIYAHRGDDEANGEPQTAVGDRLSGYLTLNQGVGPSTVTLWAFDLYRSAAGVQETAVGPSFLERGNVFAGGVQWSVPVGTSTALTPRLELRDSRAERDDGSAGLQRLGTTTRFGVDVRQEVGRAAALVLRGDLLRGSLGGDTDVDLSGYRLTLQLEARR